MRANGTARTVFLSNSKQFNLSLQKPYKNTYEVFYLKNRKDVYYGNSKESKTNQGQKNFFGKARCLICQ